MYTISDAIIYKFVENKAIVLNAMEGSCYSLNPVTTEIFQGILEGRNEKQISMRIARKYDTGFDEVFQDVTEMIGELKQEGIIH